jgi:hypothetical protein
VKGEALQHALIVVLQLHVYRSDKLGENLIVLEDVGDEVRQEIRDFGHVYLLFNEMSHARELLDDLSRAHEVGHEGVRPLEPILDVKI